ncbi:hypothetical protein [Bdellovibrio sp. HCB-162]|uniref:hypothetical protein n=1 Tax=Bdellovibrio sp. HCB-162 TaxID=3394234 RepID=UPI0039BCB652
MKPLFTLMIFVVAMANTAHADSFTTIRDGKEYMCTSTEPRNPGNAVDCVDTAYRGPFSKEESMRICSGATSKAPAECATAAYRGPFSKEESISLCVRATSATGPVDCATTAYRGPFSKEESLQLCSRGGTLANAECAIKAYRGPYSKEEALRLCKAEPALLIRSFKLMESSPEVQSKIQLFKAKVLGLFDR